MRIKINANPYTKEIDYAFYSEEKWHKLTNNNILRTFSGKEFSYYVKEIVDEIAKGRYEEIEFEGTDDDYEELLNVVENYYKDKIICYRSEYMYIMADEAKLKIQTEFDNIKKYLDENYQGENSTRIKEQINAFKEATKLEVPLCVMGGFSSGKSAFINALLGTEILPSAVTPTTAITHKIKSSLNEVGSISFVFDSIPSKITVDEKGLQIETKSHNCFFETLEQTVENSIMDNSIPCRIHQILKLLNEFDVETTKIKKEPSHLSGVIEIEIPPRYGLFEERDYQFVIYDTPGSGAASDQNHYDILKETLKNQTNGLPILVTTPKEMNSSTNNGIIQILGGAKLDLNNMIIVANRAEEEAVTGIEKLINDKYNVIRKWQSTRIYFVSSIAGLAGKKENITFYNDEYEEQFLTHKEKFLDSTSKLYRKFYNFNIMPIDRKSKITKVCDVFEQSGDEKKKLFANSGLKCIYEEILAFAEKHALYNKCASATTYLKTAIDITQEGIDKKDQELIEPMKTIKEKLDAKKLSVIEKIQSEKNNASKEIIEQYPIVVKPSIDIIYSDEISAMDKNWIERIQKKNKSDTNYFKKWKSGTSSLFENFNEANQNKVFVKDEKDGAFVKGVKNGVNKGIAGVKALVQTAKDGLDSVVTTSKTFHDENVEIRENIRNEVDEILKYKIRNIHHAMYSKSRDYFDIQVKNMKEKLIAVASNKSISEIEESEKQEIIKTIEDFPENYGYSTSNQLIDEDDIAKFIIRFGRFTFGDLGFVDSNRMLTKAKSSLENTVTEQNGIIQQEFIKFFNKWCNSLMSEIESKITKLDPALENIEEERMKLEKEKNQLVAIKDQLNDSTDILESILRLQG